MDRVCLSFAPIRRYALPSPLGIKLDLVYGQVSRREHNSSQEERTGAGDGGNAGFKGSKAE